MPYTDAVSHLPSLGTQDAVQLLSRGFLYLGTGLHSTRPSLSTASPYCAPKTQAALPTALAHCARPPLWGSSLQPALAQEQECGLGLPLRRTAGAPLCCKQKAVSSTVVMIRTEIIRCNGQFPYSRNQIPSDLLKAIVLDLSKGLRTKQMLPDSEELKMVCKVSTYLCLAPETPHHLCLLAPSNGTPSLTCHFFTYPSFFLGGGAKQAGDIIQTLLHTRPSTLPLRYTPIPYTFL